MWPASRPEAGHDGDPLLFKEGLHFLFTHLDLFALVAHVWTLLGEIVREPAFRLEFLEVSFHNHVGGWPELLRHV